MIYRYYHHHHHHHYYYNYYYLQDHFEEMRPSGYEYCEPIVLPTTITPPLPPPSATRTIRIKNGGVVPALLAEVCG